MLLRQVWEGHPRALFFIWEKWMKMVSRGTQQIWHKHQSKNPYGSLTIPPFSPKAWWWVSSNHMGCSLDTLKWFQSLIDTLAQRVEYHIQSEGHWFNSSKCHFSKSTKGQVHYWPQHNWHSHLLDLFNLDCIYLKSDGHENAHQEPECKKGGGIKDKHPGTDHKDMEWDRLCETPEFDDDNNRIASSITQIQPTSDHTSCSYTQSSALSPSITIPHPHSPQPPTSIPSPDPPASLHPNTSATPTLCPLPWPNKYTKHPTTSHPLPYFGQMNMPSAPPPYAHHPGWTIMPATSPLQPPLTTLSTIMTQDQCPILELI